VVGRIIKQAPLLHCLCLTWTEKGLWIHKMMKGGEAGNRLNNCQREAALGRKRRLFSPSCGVEERVRSKSTKVKGESGKNAVRKNRSYVVCKVS